MAYVKRLTAPDYNNKYYLQAETTSTGVPTNLISPGNRGRVLPNCFSGDTEFITDFGVRKMITSVGHIFKVPTINNDWRWATVQYFGKQTLLLVTFSNGHRYKCTANHRWEVYTHNKKLHSTKTTLELIPGMLIPVYNNGEKFKFTSVKSVVSLNKKEDVFCVIQKTTESFVLSGGEITRNCVGYAKGRICEIAGKNVPHIPGDAGQWWGNAPSSYKRSQKPKLGAIICWSNPGSYGHVAVVEQINKDGSILLSESGYRPEDYNPNRTNILGKVTGGGKWHFSVRKESPPNYCSWSGYHLQGFLIHDWCEEYDDARSEFVTLAQNRLGDNIDWTKKQLNRKVKSPWSASFISALARNLNLINVCFPDTDTCSDIARLGEKLKLGTFYSNRNMKPQPGDIIFIDSVSDARMLYKLSMYSDKYRCNDAGVVTKVTDKEIGCVFGDRSGRVSGVTYKIGSGQICGYYRPKWDNSTFESDSTHSVTFYGPLYEDENTKEDATVREVSYLNSKLEPSIYSSDIKLSVINYTSVLGSFFNELGNNLGSSNMSVVSSTADELIQIAKSEVGNGGSKYRKWYYGSDQRGVPWCAIFVSWCLAQIGIKEVKTAGAGSFARDYKSYGKWYESEYSNIKTTPKKGDLVTFTWNGMGHVPGYDAYYSDHVGIVYSVDNNKIYTVEGNSGSSNDTSSVKLHSYDRKSGSINGYFRLNSVEQGDSSSIVVKGDLTATEKQILQHLMKNGLTCAGSVGVLANIYHESGCRTDVIEYGYTFNNGGVGLCQWTNYPRSSPTGRKTNMVKFVGSDWRTDLTGQLDFLLHELKTGYTGVLSTLKSAPNNVKGAKDSADVFVRKFEIPANVDSASGTRQSTAEKYWKKLAVR